MLIVLNMSKKPFLSLLTLWSNLNCCLIAIAYSSDEEYKNLTHSNIYTIHNCPE